MTEPQTQQQERSERELWQALRAGDRQAAEALVAMTYEQVYASLFRMTSGDRDLAADLTQETYRKAWASLDSFRGNSQFSTWLYRVAYNTFLNHIRKPRRLQPLDDQAALQIIDEKPGARDHIERREVEERLRRAVMGLPEELRFTVSARFWGDCPVREIARQEEVTGAAIRKRLKKAFQHLRLILQEDAA